MSDAEAGTARIEERAAVDAARAGDEAAFAELVEPHRRELQVHCYRMLGSYEESEDLVQETFLRAWRGREGFQGRSTFRAWLYRIATNACLDVLDSRPRRVLPHHLRPASDASVYLPPRTDLPWLQPYPDRLLDEAGPGDVEPESAAVARETIELTFLAAIQHLPPRQRAVLILRDVLGWSAKETAALMEASVPSANSALQRARATMRRELPERRLEWASTEPNEEERALLRRFMDAYERADIDAVAALLRADARATMPPYPMWHQGRESIIAALTVSWDPVSPAHVGRLRMVPVRANRQPSVAIYRLLPGGTAYEPFGIALLRIEGAQVVEITGFGAELFPAFHLAPSLDR